MSENSAMAECCECGHLYPAKLGEVDNFTGLFTCEWCADESYDAMLDDDEEWFEKWEDYS